VQVLVSWWKKQLTWGELMMKKDVLVIFSWMEVVGFCSFGIVEIMRTNEKRLSGFIFFTFKLQGTIRTPSLKSRKACFFTIGRKQAAWRFSGPSGEPSAYGQAEEQLHVCKCTGTE
jgi:hypothetical protein